MSMRNGRLAIVVYLDVVVEEKAYGNKATLLCCFYYVDMFKPTHAITI